MKKFKEYDVDVIVVDVREWDDPGKMTKQQFKVALDNAMVPTWESNFFSRLDRASELKMKLKSI